MRDKWHRCVEIEAKKKLRGTLRYTYALFLLPFYTHFSFYGSIVDFLRIRSGGACIRSLIDDTQKTVYTRGGAYTHPLCIHTHRSRIRTDPRIHTRVHISYMHPLRIRTHHSRKRTHPRIRTSIRTRCVYTPTARVNAPARVYAPDAAYTRGRDERHASVPPHPMTMLPYLLLLLLLRLLLPLRRVRASTSISTSCP